MEVVISPGGCALRVIVMSQLLAEEHLEIEGVLIVLDERLLITNYLRSKYQSIQLYRIG